MLPITMGCEFYVGRFTVGSNLVIYGKNNDGKDQHDQQRSDNRRGGATVNVGSYSESPMTVRSIYGEEDRS
jgi:hypothetical protein